MGRFTGKPYFDAVETGLKFVAVLFVVELADLILPIGLDRFGIWPRQVIGLPGILLAPLLHAGLGHLVANAGPLLVLLVLMFWNRRYRPWATLAAVWVLGGLGTWIFGRGGAVHVGASGLVYGLAAFLVTAGVVGRSWQAALIAVLVAFSCWGLVYGMLPQRGPISWEGHLFGALAGAYCAWRIRNKLAPRTR